MTQFTGNTGPPATCEAQVNATTMSACLAIAAT